MSNGFQWISSSPTDLGSIKKEHARKCHVHTKHDHQDHENWSFSALITIMFIIFLKKNISFPFISPYLFRTFRRKKSMIGATGLLAIMRRPFMARKHMESVRPIQKVAMKVQSSTTAVLFAMEML